MNMCRREGLQKSLFPEILFMKKNLDADERRLSLIFIFNYLRLSAEICVPKIIILKSIIPHLVTWSVTSASKVFYSCSVGVFDP